MYTALVEVYEKEAATEPLCSYHFTGDLMKVTMAVMKGLVAYQNGSMEAMMQEFNTLNIGGCEKPDYVYKVYPEADAYEVWQGDKKLAGRGVKATKKPVKRRVSSKGARYISHQERPEIVRLAWGEKVYDHYLYSVFLLERYLWLRRKAGENKAALWLKKNADHIKKVA